MKTISPAKLQALIFKLSTIEDHIRDEKEFLNPDASGEDDQRNDLEEIQILLGDAIGKLEDIDTKLRKNKYKS